MYLHERSRLKNISKSKYLLKENLPTCGRSLEPIKNWSIDQVSRQVGNDELFFWQKHDSAASSFLHRYGRFLIAYYMAKHQLSNESLSRAFSDAFSDAVFHVSPRCGTGIRSRNPNVFVRMGLVYFLLRQFKN